MIVLIVIALIGGFLIGRLTAPTENARTFYASIEKNEANYVLVLGLDVNDINHRSHFDFSKKDGIELIWRNTEIAWDDLDVGDNVAVTYTGEVQETYPAGIIKVLRVELLEDEK